MVHHDPLSKECPDGYLSCAHPDATDEQKVKNSVCVKRTYSEELSLKNCPVTEVKIISKDETSDYKNDGKFNWIVEFDDKYSIAYSKESKSLPTV